MNDDQFDADGLGCFRGCINGLAIMAVVVFVLMAAASAFAFDPDDLCYQPGGYRLDCKHHGFMPAPPTAPPQDPVNRDRKEDVLRGYRGGLK